MATELTPLDIRQVPELAALVEEVRTTRKRRRILRDNEEIAILMPPAPASPCPRRAPATGPRPTRQSVTDRTAGALKAYRLPRPLTHDEEREAFEQGVADEAMESLER
jgi:hypothetical protein